MSAAAGPASATRSRVRTKVAMASAAAAWRSVPKWVLLEPYVFRRDDDADSLPDDAEAPLRASGTTSWGANFRIAFSLAEPPKISRVYAHMPGFPDPLCDEPLIVVAAHRHLALFEVTIGKPSASQGLGHNLFILRVDQKNPGSSKLTPLPPCTEPRYDLSHRFLRKSSKARSPRLLDSMTSGLWCGGDNEEEFVVAELLLGVRYRGRNCTSAFVDICFLRSSSTDDHQLGRCKWDTMRVPILPTATDDDLRNISRWITDIAIPFQEYLCWIDYHLGILFWDVSLSTVSLLWFPADEYSLASTHKTPCSSNGGVAVVDHGRALKFAYVARHDCRCAFEPPKPRTGFTFTITCHTLVLGDDDSMSWKEDYTVTSDELPDYLQRGGLPMFPRVDIDKPHLVHFLFVEFGTANGQKHSVLSIDMSTKTVESFYLYMDGRKPIQTDDPYFIEAKRSAPTPMPFLSCEFPRISCLSRKRKDME